MGCPSLYKSIPSATQSGAEAEDEFGPNTSFQQGLIASSSKGTDDQLKELGGRARAILKTSFEETKAFNLPRGHPTVAFTEPQVYHLVRVLTDETLRMSHATMERMVSDAVKGKPPTTPSRDSSYAETGAFTSTESDDQEVTNQGGSGDSSSFGESNSAGEMAMITT